MPKRHSYQPWTGPEVERLRQLTLTPGMDTHRAAELLGRRLSSVQGACAAHELEFADQKLLREHRRSRRRAVGRLVREGVCAADVARQLGEPVATIENDIKRMRLRGRVRKMTQKEGGARGYAAVVARHGGASLGAVKRTSGRVRSMRDGWPACAPQHARYLDRLFVAGAMTARALAAHFGHHINYTRKVIKRFAKAGTILIVRRGRSREYDLAEAVRVQRNDVLARREAGELPLDPAGAGASIR